MYDQFPRDFKGIWLPKELLADERLTPQEKMLAAEIDSLDCGELRCFASNEYFQKIFKVSERVIQQMISKLKALGLISFHSTDGRTRRLQSHLKTVYTLFNGSRVRNSSPQGCETLHPSPIDSFIERENIVENINIKTIQKEKETLKKDETSAEACALGGFVLEEIKKRKPNFKIVNKPEGQISQKWIDDCKKLLKIRKAEEIKKVIIFALDHDFWFARCLSPEKILKHLDALEILMDNKPKTKTLSPEAEQDRERRLILQKKIEEDMKNGILR